MKTKSEQYIYDHLEKVYSEKSIHNNLIDELYDDLKEQVQRKIKKSISLDKINELVSKYTIKNNDGSLTFKIKKNKSIQINMKESLKKETVETVINNIKPIKKIKYDMFEELDDDINDINKINDTFDNINDTFDNINKINDISNTFDDINKINEKYELSDKPLKIVQIINTQPVTNDFFLNEQKDDILDEKCIKRREQLRYLKSIISPEQKSAEWYILRRERITASDGGTIIGWNKYNSPYECLFKKIEEPPFCGNENVFHGNKYEDIASLLYQDRMNVKLSNFGLLPHPTCKFLGASPDVIIDEYKLDGIHKTNLVGRMIEIKCPSKRKIITSGEIFDQCPKYYWVQVQLQLECCDLDECDFVQCEISEYSSWDEFLDDTHPTESYKSEIFGFEKGCVIQILPKSVKKDINEKTYNQIVYDNAKHIYPPTIYMSPFQYLQWIEQIKKDIETKPEYIDKYFDKVCYWRLENMGCCLIKRDYDWYNKYYLEYEKFWNNVLFFRHNKDKFELLKKYLNLYDKPKYGWSIATNDNIQNVIKILCNDKHPDYIKKINKLEKDIEIQKIDNNKQHIYSKPIYSKPVYSKPIYSKPNYIKKKISIDNFDLLDD
jgi:putative phage-type endonuclease